MNALENKIEQPHEQHKTSIPQRHSSDSGRVWTGAFLLLIGVAALLRIAFRPIVPDWLFSWQMLLIVLGLFIGVRHAFRGGAWFILMLLGGIFLANEYYPGFIDERYIWPLALIAVGIFIIFNPRRREHRWQEARGPQPQQNTAVLSQAYSETDDDVLDSTSVFGGVKKTMLSKNFKGGEIVNIMGGSEINLSQCDIQGRVVLEVTQIFGGTKVIVPSHWMVKPEMAAIFGGIDDKRTFHNTTIDHNKVLVLKGTSIFGGIEIRSF